MILQAYIPQRKGKGTGLFFPVQCLFLKWVCFDKNCKYVVLQVCVVSFCCKVIFVNEVLFEALLVLEGQKHIILV